MQSLRHRQFRIMWSSDASAGIGEQMELVVIGWYVFSATDSPLLVTLYGALRFTGTLPSPFFGLIADRVSRRTLLVAVRATFLAAAATMLFLALSGRLEVWYVLGIAAVAGLARGFDNVIRQALLADLIPRAELTNAVAMSRVARDVTQLMGPIVAGVMLDRLGIGSTYAVIAGAYGVAVAAGVLMGPVQMTAAVKRGSVLHDLALAVAYVRRHEVVLAILLLAFLVNLTAFPLSNGLMPVFAKDVLEMGPAGLGALLSTYSVGALLGSVAMAVVPPVRLPGRALLFGCFAWHGLLLLFALSGWLATSFALLVAVGLMQSFSMVVMSMLLLRETGDRFRGRVMGLRSLVIYGLPVGLLATGAIAERHGAPLALAVSATLGMALTALIAAWLRDMWRVREG